MPGHRATRRSVDLYLGPEVDDQYAGLSRPRPARPPIDQYVSDPSRPVPYVGYTAGGK
jgi:hypothetical protein